MLPLLVSVLGVAAAPLDAVTARPDAVVDLATDAGARLAGAEWRWHDAEVVSHELAPRAGAADFDDSGWGKIAPAALEERRGGGKTTFGWYRTRVTIPPRVGETDTAGATVVFEIVVDDYAEVWVDGKLPVVLGQQGGDLVAGFNSPNRVVLTRDARPGQQFQIAVFAMNGPVSAVPTNMIWVRSATLDIYKAGGPAVEPVAGTIQRKDPAVDKLIGPDAKFEKLAGGFLFTEGPVWHKDGYLLFSDPNANTIYRWSPDAGVSIFRAKSGYSGADIGRYHQPGSNGLTLDKEGRLTIAQHGNRRVVRVEKNGMVTVLADRYQGKRLNSPNDLVYRSDGGLYFTDPPFGLPKVYDDPAKEIPFSGVYFVKDAVLRLVSRDLKGPNGVALSPDERTLYVSNWDEKKKIIMRYDALPDGSLAHGKVFFDMTSAPGEEALDGLKIDRAGNVYASGPGGVWIISPEGKHIGTLQPPELPANMAWGDADGNTLYMTARSGVYRLRLVSGGVHP